jgi:hypothetical protein
VVFRGNDTVTNPRVEHGGKDKLDLVKFTKDQATFNICKTWAGDFDSAAAQEMGFEGDSYETGFSEAVQEFKEEMKAAGKLV